MSEAEVWRLIRLAAIWAGQPIIPVTPEEVAEAERRMTEVALPESLSAANVLRRLTERTTCTRRSNTS